MADVVERYRIVGENAVGAAFNQILRQSKSTADRMASVFRTAFAGVSLVSIANVTKQMVDRADSISTLAETFGTTAEELSRLDYVAKQSNTSIEELTSGLTAFQKNLVLAGEDSGRARKAIAALGISASELTRVSLPRQLEQIAEAFRQIQNPTERVRIAAQLFGDEVGRRMIPVLERGAEGIRALGLESDRLGNTLTRAATEKLKQADESLKRFDASWTGLKTNLAISVAPALEKIADLMGRIARPDSTLAVMMFENAIINMEQKARMLGTTLEQTLEPGSELARKIAMIQSTLDRMRGNTGPSNPRRGFFAPLIESAETAEDRVKRLRKEMEEVDRIWEEMKAASEAQRGLPPILTESDAESTRIINERMNEILESNIELRNRTVEVEGAFFEVNDAAKSLMDTLKDEGARRAVGYISDAIMGLGGGARDFAKGMIDAFRRILADQAAQQLMSWFMGLGKGGGGGGGFFGALASGIGALFGGGFKLPAGSTPTVPGGYGRGFASGGFMSPGSWGVVGERGPELAFAGNQGATIVPFQKGGQMSAPVVNVHVTTNVDARGASVELINRLPAVLEENRRAAVDEAEVRFVEGLRRNRYRLSG